MLITKHLMLLSVTIIATFIFIFVISGIPYPAENGSNNVFAASNTSLNEFNFVAVGDWGCTPETKKVVNGIIDEEPELVLGLGDNSYRKNAKCWLDIVNPIDDKLKIAIGNHDARQYINGTSKESVEQLHQYMNYFIMGKQYYSFDYKNVHFIALSSEAPFKVGSKQHKFVTTDLQLASQNPSVNWIVVYLHKPMYTSPNTGHDNMDLAISSLRDTYHQLFDRYGVDLVLQGHVHNYQRTFPINYGDQGNSHNPKITSYQANNYVDPAGTVFAIVGTGGIASELGKAYHNFTGPAEKYTAVQFQGIGFLDLQVVQNGTKLVGTFHDNDRTIKDHFSITKLENYQKKSLAHYAAEPKLKNGYDESFKVESIVTGLKSPTDMTFLGHDDILVLEKNNGKVQRVINGKISEKPLLDVNVSNENERGLLGVAVSEVNNKSAYVYLYYTEANASSEKCTKPDYCLPGTDPIGNRLYSFNLTQDKSKLVHPKLLLNLPATPGSVNNGGKIIIGTDNLIYLAVGALSGHNTMAQNFENGSVVDGTGGILRINGKGHPLDGGILGNEYPLNMYYAYGIRNSFGMDFDHVTGNLWDTENGPEFGDEINMVEQGFNSGWRDVQGIWKHKGGKPGIVLPSPNNLTDFEGKGKYSSPEFTFFNPVGVAAIKFFNSDKMGSGFKDDIFVADSLNGMIYRFNLEEGRTNLFLKGELADKIANSTDELYPVTFAEGFSEITDLEVGSDGYLYVLDYGKGAIYRIIPT